MAVAFASGTLTSTGVFANTETVTIAGKVYTFQTVLTNVDGNVLIGANAAASLQNLKDAINLGPGAGTTYAAAMTINPEVEATAVTATTLVVKSSVAGAVGNRVTTTEAVANASWGGATLSGGSGRLDTDLRALIAAKQINADVLQSLIDLIDPGADE